MAFEKIKLFGKIEFELSCTATDTLALLTDVPGPVMAQRVALSVAPQARGVYHSRLPYNMQGHLIQLRYTPGVGQTTLYGARVWARELPGGQWDWFELPVVGTPTEYSPAALPIPGTPDEFSAAALPIPGTADEYSAGALPIPPTPDEFQSGNLPIPGTPDEFSAAALPVKATPAIGEWADVDVDK
jgi:hypothetical protein